MRRVVSFLGVAALVAVAGLPAAAQTVPRYESSISLVSADQLWASWRPGCPVGPEQLRRVTVSHWGFDSAVRTGSLVVHVDVAGEVAAVFGELFARRFPIERIVPIEAYGGSDDASMAANNTSAFNCRPVTGGTGWSNHAFGRAIDLNPVQNPYVLGGTVLPPAGSAHLQRTPAPGRVLAGDSTVAAFAAWGWNWGGAWRSPVDYQHFERPGPPARPGPIQAGASLASTSTSTEGLGLAWRGGDGGVRHRSRSSSGWSATVDLGGYSASTPDVTSWGGERLDVFVLGADGAVWHRAGAGGSWGPWTSLGGRFLSGPSAVAHAVGRLDVFGRGLDSSLWTNSWNGSQWTGWRSLGGQLTSDPDAVSWDDHRLDVFGRGVDGAVWHRGFEAGTWFPWDSLGGRSLSGPGAASRNPGGIDVFTVGPDGALYASAWTGAGWLGWYHLGGVLTSDPDAVAQPGGVVHVVATGGDGRALWGRTLSGSWAPWSPWPAP